MVWFKDELGGSWWACNTLNESHRNEKDLEVVHVCDYTTKYGLRELIGATYTNKCIYFSIAHHLRTL